MRIYGVGTAKNEGDVIGDSIEHALRYCDKVVYIDNGSEDDTWDIIQAKAAEHPDRVIAFGQLLIPYVEGIRSVIYNEIGPTLTGDDWWMKLDADEFINEDPRPVVAEAHAAGNDVVRAWHAQFYYTDVDHQRWLAGDEDTSLPVTERRRFYRTNWRQVHLWRNVVDQRWTDTTRSIPEQTTRIHRRAVMNRHYQFRDPDQITRRLRVRMGLQEFPHVGSTEWDSVVRPASECLEWDLRSPLKIDTAYYYSLRLRQVVAAKLGRRIPTR